jgi:5-methylcytosine-specific restriction endonuclease McrA
MATHSLSHLSSLSDASIERGLAERVARERSATADQLVYLAEFDARRLYAPAGFESMFAYCLRALRFSEDEAYKRIRAARAARRFPAIFDRVAAGRLHLAAVVLLAPFLTMGNADELLAAGEHRTKAEIQQLLAARFPQPDLPARIEAVRSATPGEASRDAQLVPEPVGASRSPIKAELVPEPVGMTSSEQALALPAREDAALPPHAEPRLTPGPAEAPAPAPTVPALSPWTAPPSAPRPRVTPLSVERFALQCTVSRETHDKLCRAKALLGHQVPGGNLADVLDRALDALIEKLEKRKFAATARPRRTPTPRPDAPPSNPRRVPAAAKRAVWKRDGGRCTFVSRHGRRCEARSGLELDHEIPVARGGRATTGNLRLRCRAHNQMEAEREFGAGYVEHRRQAAREAMEQRRRGKQAHARAAADRHGATVDRAKHDAVSGARAGGRRAQPRTRATHTPSPSGTITASS